MTGNVASLYVEISWVTTIIPENCFIYERQMSFSLAVAVFECRGLAPMLKAKAVPVLILSFAFMAFSH